MSSEMREIDVSKLSADEAVKCDDRTFADWLAFCGNGYEAHGSSYNLALIEAANRIASRALLVRTEAGADDPILRGLARAVGEIDSDDGRWISCSGCYETEDGHPVGDYPHSPILGCALGGGCSECGGLGAVWDTTDYAAFAEELMEARPQDASGDAEVLTAHGIKALDRCCEELRYWIGLADDMNFDEMTVSAFETAIESMEMRKANAMQAKEAK
jgi:hypothetical protein